MDLSIDTSAPARRPGLQGSRGAEPHTSTDPPGPDRSISSLPENGRSRGAPCSLLAACMLRNDFLHEDMRKKPGLAAPVDKDLEL
jgi:hypothetical protein